MAVSLSTRARQWLGTLRKSLPFPVTGRGVWSSWSSPAWNDFTFDRLAHEGYRLNAAVNICIQKLATSYQQAPILVSDRGQLVEDSPIGMLLNAPNPLMSWHELAIIIQVYKSIGGACRLHKVRGDNGEVLELWPYHIGQIGAIPGTTQWIDHYVFTGGDQPKIDTADIIDLHWPSVDPRNVWEALPPLMAVAREVDTDSEATRYLYALLYNDAVPMTIIKTKRTLTDTQFGRLAAQFQNRHGGSNRGTVAILEEDADVSRMALNLEEMAFEAMRRVPESRIAAMFGVPAMYAGLTVGLTQSTYNNVSEARKSFFEDTIIPQATLDDGAIARALEADFGKFSIHRAWDRVPALQENLDAVYTRELNAYKTGVTIKNEARARMGLPAVEAIPLPPGIPPYPVEDGYSFYKAPQPVLPMEPVEPPDPMAEPPKALAAKALQDKATTGIETRIQRAMRDYLEAQYEQAARGVE